MREYINSFTVANEVRMKRSVHEGSFLLVEGPTDARLYKRFINRIKCQIVISHNKENAVEALNILEQDEFEGVLAIVDADFWYVQKLELTSRHLILTDAHDVEMMLFQSPALQKTLIEFGSEEKIHSFERGKNRDILTVILDAGKQLGYLRWVSLQKDLSLKFEEVNFSDFIDKDDLSVDINRLIQILKSRSENHTVRDEDLLSNMKLLIEENHDIWHICCGHDLVQILSVGLRKAFGTNNATEVHPVMLEKHLRSSYEKVDFKKTNIYSSIIKWENENRPFIVLSEELKKLANSNLEHFIAATKKLEELIESNARETEFQILLEANPWMFGSEYSQLLNRRSWVLGEQQDFMLKRATDGYLELIEIKTPIDGKALFLKDQSHNSFYPRSELSEVIGQVANYLQNLDADSYRIKAQTGEDVSKIRAKIIIGRSINREQEQATRQYNAHLNRIEIITYDQLLSLSKQVIEHQKLAFMD